jgi:hypothetical protein
MKQFIFYLILVLLVPILGFSQTSSWRNRTQSSGSSNTTQNNSVSSWRTPQSRQSVQTPIYTPPRQNNVFYEPYPHWGWNGWNRFYGAPLYGWDFYTPFYYNDRWGYREPARVYHYNDGRRDTIRGEKTHFSFGLQKPTFKNQMGMWFTLGKKVYFIADYNNTINADNSEYFANKTIWNYYNDLMTVNGVTKPISEFFPLSSDIIRRANLYAGIGKRFGRFGTHISAGFVRENVRYRYKDDIGYITFPKNKDSYLIYKFGALYDIKSATIKVDYDPILKVGYFGAGINF